MKRCVALHLFYLFVAASAGRWKWEKDFVAVIVSTSNRLALTHSTRCWRNGMRTIIATNASDVEAKELTRIHKAHHETYVPVADELRESADRAHGRRPGDVRAALLPSLAHQLLKGDYKWMLYADDVRTLRAGQWGILSVLHVQACSASCVHKSPRMACKVACMCHMVAPECLIVRMPC